MKPISKAIKEHLTGVEALQLLQQGHMVRRFCWVENFLIRICNEDGFDEQGNCIVDPETPIYTHATNGYFMHLAYSSQPFATMHGTRAGEGVAMLFASDWEDHGFISADDFNKLAEENKEEVRKLERKYLKALEY